MVPFLVRYREFESWEQLNQQAERWLRDDADPRVHGKVKEVVAERFERAAPHLRPLPPHRYDTSYRESRRVAWDGCIEVRGNRYSVPGELTGDVVSIRITLDGVVKVFHADELVVSDRLKPREQRWGDGATGPSSAVGKGLGAIAAARGL